MVRVPNKTAAAISRMVEAKRANGIYSSPFINSLQQKDLVVA
jgi:hypothetical protein